MRSLSIFALPVVGAILLAACGSPAPAVQPTAAQASAATAMPPTVAAPPTQVRASNPTAAGPAEAASTKVNVTLVDNTITSSLTTFKAGTPYTFVIQSNARHEHNFVIAPPVALAGGYAEALAQALLAVDETQIPPGSSYSVDFTFPASAVGATLEFSCLIRRHYEDGMRLSITVTN
jgi:uncharacterized cupredoxin-like copper-binding protein